MGKLIIRQLICHQKESALLGRDKVRLSIWGNSQRRFTFNKDSVTSGTALTINQEVEFTDQALVMLVEEDRPTDPDDFLTSSPLVIKENPANQLSCLIDYQGGKAKYEIIYDVIVAQATAKLPLSMSGELIIKSLICFTTQDSMGADEIKIDVRQKNTLLLAHQCSINTHGIVDINQTVTIEDNVLITVYEQDVGPRSIIDADDLLGMHAIPIKETHNGVLSFTESGAHYQLIYDIIPKVGEYKHTLYIVPKLVEGPDYTPSIWVGSFSGEPASSTNWSLSETSTGRSLISSQPITCWQTTKPPCGKSYLYHCSIEPNPASLQPNTRYRVTISQGQAKQEASFITLPQTIPLVPAQAFTVFLGSCFESEYDDGRVQSSYKRLAEQYGYPHINLFVGDQVYLDHPMTSNGMRYSESTLQTNFVAKYERNWDALQGVMSAAGNVLIGDDHEIYNNTPFRPLEGHGVLERALPAIRDEAYLNQWAKIARQLYYAIQTTHVYRTFNIGNELSFFAIEMRLQRDRKREHLLPPNDFEALKMWIRNLKSPGVLILGEPLLLTNTDDKLNTAYQDYHALINVIAEPSDYDIIVLTGDQHYCRLATVELPSKKSDTKRHLYEIIASPLSLIEADPTALTGYTTDPIKQAASGRWIEGDASYAEPSTFPPAFVETAQTRFPVRYLFGDKNSPRVTSKGVTDPGTSAENFCRIGFFRRKPTSPITMQVSTWLPRIAGPDGKIPKKAWEYRTEIHDSAIPAKL